MLIFECECPVLNVQYIRDKEIFIVKRFSSEILQEVWESGGFVSPGLKIAVEEDKETSKRTVYCEHYNPSSRECEVRARRDICLYDRKIR